MPGSSEDSGDDSPENRRPKSTVRPRQASKAQEPNERASKATDSDASAFLPTADPALTLRSGFASAPVTLRDVVALDDKREIGGTGERSRFREDHRGRGMVHQKEQRVENRYMRGGRGERDGIPMSDFNATHWSSSGIPSGAADVGVRNNIKETIEHLPIPEVPLPELKPWETPRSKRFFLHDDRSNEAVPRRHSLPFASGSGRPRGGMRPIETRPKDRGLNMKDQNEASFDRWGASEETGSGEGGGRNRTVQEGAGQARQRTEQRSGRVIEKWGHDLYEGEDTAPVVRSRPEQRIGETERRSRAMAGVRDEDRWQHGRVQKSDRAADGVISRKGESVIGGDRDSAVGSRSRICSFISVEKDGPSREVSRTRKHPLQGEVAEGAILTEDDGFDRAPKRIRSFEIRRHTGQEERGARKVVDGVGESAPSAREEGRKIQHRHEASGPSRWSSDLGSAWDARGREQGQGKERRNKWTHDMFQNLEEPAAPTENADHDYVSEIEALLAK